MLNRILKILGKCFVNIAQINLTEFISSFIDSFIACLNIFRIACNFVLIVRMNYDFQNIFVNGFDVWINISNTAKSSFSVIQTLTNNLEREKYNYDINNCQDYEHGRQISIDLWIITLNYLISSFFHLKTSMIFVVINVSPTK